MSESTGQDQKRVRPAALVIALALMTSLLIFVVFRVQPPAAKGEDALPGQFSAGRVLALLEEILDDASPHILGSEQNQVVRQNIVAVLERMGYEVRVQQETACRAHTGAYSGCAEVHNIMARLPGRENGPALMLTAHYDSVPTTAGAADDGMAVAGILEMARILKEEGPHRNSIVFLLTDGEELGMLGAKGFVSGDPWAEDVAVVLNQEARGNSGQSFMFETSEDNRWLVDAYASAVRRPASSSLHYEIYRILPNNTDLTVFRADGMAGMNFGFIGRVSHYHTFLDNFENLDLGSVQHQGDSLLAVAQELAEVDLANPPTGGSAWTDILGIAVVHWPASYTIPLAFLALILLIGITVRLIRRRLATIGGLFMGFLTAFLCLLAAIVAGLVLVLLVSLVSGNPFPYYAHPLPIRVGVWAAALLCGGLLATATARRSGAWGLAVGGWFLWALLALFLGILLPGGAIMLLLPTFLAGILFAIVAFSRLSGSAPAREAVFIAAALGAGIVWLYLSLIFESAVGFSMSPAITLGLGLVAGSMAPLFALPPNQTLVRRLLLLATAITMIAATVIAILVPPFSETDPQQVNLTHFDDRDNGDAFWAVTSIQGEAPEPLRILFDSDPVAIFPWIADPLPVTSAQSSRAPAPFLEIISEELVDGERVVTGLLRSPRGADSVLLHIPVEALISVVIPENEFLVTPEGDSNGYYSFLCFGRACEGLTVQLHLKGVDPVEVLVVDTVYELPPGGETFDKARPSTAVPAHMGDESLIMTRTTL